MRNIIGKREEEFIILGKKNVKSKRNIWKNYMNKWCERGVREFFVI